VQTRDDNDSLTVEFINWYYLKVQADGAGGGQAQQNFNQFIHRVQNRPENPIAGHVFDDALQEVEQLKGDSLAFKVVFQRSLFLALLEFSKITDEHIQQLDGDGADASEDILDDQGAEDSGDEGEQLDEIGVLAALTRVRAEVFVNALNSLTNAAPDFLELRCEIDSGSVRHLLWNGTLYDPAGGTIDFTGAAASRGLELMVWTAILHLLDAEEHSSVQGSFEEFWDFLSGDELPPVHRRLRNSRRRFVEGAAIRILRASRPDFDDLTDDERNEAAHEECKTRFRWVWQRVVEI
jgi:hypothetical protein